MRHVARAKHIVVGTSVHWTVLASKNGASHVASTRTSQRDDKLLCVQIFDTHFLAGQIGLDPGTMRLVDGGLLHQYVQALRNCRAVCAALLNNTGLDSLLVSTIFVDASVADQLARLTHQVASASNVALARSVVVGVQSLPAAALVEIQFVVGKSLKNARAKLGSHLTLPAGVTSDNAARYNRYSCAEDEKDV